MATDAVRVEGLSRLRRSLRETDRDALREVRQVIRRAADIVADDARARAPRRTGRLQTSIRASASGNRGLVRSRLPYAAVHEYGGTISPRGAPIKIAARGYITEALRSNQDAVLRAMQEGLDTVTDRHGWA